MQQNFITRLDMFRKGKLIIISLITIGLFYLTSCGAKQTASPTGEATSTSTEINTRNPMYYYNIGLAKLEDGNMAEAIAYLNKAYKLAPRDYNILNALGIAYGRVGEYDKAEKFLKKAIAVQPNKGEAYTNLGVLYAIQKRYKDAIKYLSKAVSLENYKNKDKALFNLALLYLKLGDNENYEKYIRKSIAYNPFNPLPYVSLGNYYLKNRQYLNAYDVFLSALSNGLETPEIFLGLGKTHYYLKNYDKAKHYLNKAARMVKNNPLLKQEIETYLAKIKRKEALAQTDNYYDNTDILNESYFPTPQEEKRKSYGYTDNSKNVEDDIIDLSKYQPAKERIQTPKKRRTYTSYKKPKTTTKKRTTTVSTKKKKIISYGYPEKKTLPKLLHKYYIQVGAFSTYSKALEVKKRIEALGVNAKIIRGKVDKYYKVIIGYFDSSTEAKRKRDELAKLNPLFRRAIVKYVKEGK